MGTATILGTEYQTVVMPDGKEWMAASLAWISPSGSSWYGDAADDDGDGRYYNASAGLPAVVSALIGSDWRVPTYADAVALQAACQDAYLHVQSMVADPDRWFTPNAASNTTGFSATPTGGYQAYGGTWIGKDVSLFGVSPVWGSFCLANPLQGTGVGFGSMEISQDSGRNFLLGINGYPLAGFAAGNRYPVRLVRDYTPIFHGFEGMDFLVAPEWGYEPKISPSLSWTKTASGLWRCLDDGAAFDAYDAEITVKVSGAVHSAWESFIAANRGTQVAYFAPAGVRPFGPHIDCTAGVQVVIGDAWSTDWRVGITADCYTLHIPMRYVGGYTPTLATMPAVVARKYPTPTWFYPTKVHATEAGTATAAPRDTETQTTQVIIDNLDQAGAAAMVNWCLYQRGASFTYTPTAGCFPFGVAAGNGPFTVRLIGWTSQKPKPNRWDMTLDFAREA